MIGDGFASVLEAAKDGAPWAFATLYRDLNPALLRFFAARAPSESEDLTSETWLHVARGLRSFDGNERELRGWVFTIAHRRLVQHWRSAARRRSEPSAPEVIAELVGPEDTEAAALDASSAVSAARAIAAALSRDQADVVILRVVAGLDVAQVARILGKREGTVRVLQHKALRRLAARFPVEALTQ